METYGKRRGFSIQEFHQRNFPLNAIMAPKFSDLYGSRKVNKRRITKEMSSHSKEWQNRNLDRMVAMMTSILQLTRNCIPKLCGSFREGDWEYSEPKQTLHRILLHTRSFIQTACATKVPWLPDLDTSEAIKGRVTWCMFLLEAYYTALSADIFTTSNLHFADARKEVAKTVCDPNNRVIIQVPFCPA